MNTSLWWKDETEDTRHTLDLKAFETSMQIDEYIFGLKRKMLPVKLANIGRAAYNHDLLIRSQEYSLANTEIALLKATLTTSILTRFISSGLNVIDIGSGNGMKAVVVLEGVRQKFSRLNYIGLDYSRELLQIATRYIATQLGELDATTYQIDFEAKAFPEIVEKARRGTGFPSLLLFLGHTLGNPCHRQQVLTNIAASLGQDDLLLIGVELYRPYQVNSLLEHYRNESFYQAIFAQLTFAGFQREDGLLEVLFNETTRNVETYFRLNRNVTVQVSPSESIQFKEGDKLLIFLSHKFDEIELQEMFSLAGLNSLETSLNEDQTYVLAATNKGS